MQDYSYFDNISAEPQIDVEDEAIQLQNLADNVGSHLWSYKQNAQQEYDVDGKDHIGIIAQDLLKVPGLAGAVKTDGLGNLKVDTDYVAVAALAYCAALARKLLGQTNVGETENGEASTELPQELPGAETVDTTGTTTSTAEETENIQPAVEQPEAVGTV